MKNNQQFPSLLSSSNKQAMCLLHGQLWQPLQLLNAFYGEIWWVFGAIISSDRPNERPDRSDKCVCGPDERPKLFLNLVTGANRAPELSINPIDLPINSPDRSINWSQLSFERLFCGVLLSILIVLLAANNIVQQYLINRFQLNHHLLAVSRPGAIAYCRPP
ncbi:MAG: hypothetical protein QM726_12775 [Chitinophagaceae bacterium]